MTAEGLRDLEWGEAPGWEDIKPTYLVRAGEFRFSSSDVESFVIGKYRDVARKSGMPYQEVKKVLLSENEAFHSFEKNFFESFRYADNIQNFQKLFKVPDVSQIGKINCCERLLEELSPKEQLEVLVKLLITTKDTIKLITEEMEKKNQ